MSNGTLTINPNVYSGIICRAIGFPVDMLPVLFAIGRPRQVYTGHDTREYVPPQER